MEFGSELYPISPLTFAALMTAGMLVCFEFGRRLGHFHLKRGGLVSRSRTDEAVFALYGLLLAFTFSGAPERLADREKLVAEEANTIGTAYLRVDLLEPESQPAMRKLFRDYLDERLASYKALPNRDESKVHLERSIDLQQKIWAQAVAASYRPGTNLDAARLLFLPALNKMIDITSTRTMAAYIHPPLIIFALLFLLALVCSALAGYGVAGDAFQSWLHIFAFVGTVVITVFIILEIEYPRLGMINIREYDQMLVDLRRSMS